MTFFTGWSIRTSLFMLVFIAVAPALAIIVYSGVEQQRETIADINTSSLTLVSAISGDLEHTVAATRQMLTTLSTLSEVKTLDSQACNAIFADILKKNPSYNSLQAFRPNGDHFASAIPPSGVINVRDRKYFRDAVRTKDFSAGEYIVGRTAKKPMLNFSYPVLDDSGTLLAVIQAGINLAHFNELFDKSRLPEGSLLIMVDHRGTILYHSADSATFMGTSDNHRIFGEMVTQKTTDTVVTRNLDGTNQIMAIKRLWLEKESEPYLFMRLQVPEAAAVAKARSVMTRNILVLAAASFCAGLCALVFAHFSIINRTEKLVRVSEQMADGNLEVNSGIPHNEGEFGRIAHAVDTLADALKQRNEDIFKYVDEIESAVTWALDEKAKTEAIIGSIGDGISIQDREYRILYQNEVHKGLMGDHVGRFCYEAYEQQSVLCRICPVEMAFRDGSVHVIEKDVQIDGKQLFVLITASPLRDSTGEIIGGIEVVKNITDWKLAEIEREKMSEKLAESNRELQHFAYIASHDLQEPLRTITSFIQLLSKRYRGKLDQDADDFIGFITDGAARMQQLINDLLAYSRVSSRGNVFTRFDAGKLLETVRANLTHAIAESQAVITSDTLPDISGDETQIMQLFQNLIANAVKFRGTEPPRIHVGVSDIPEFWEFSVSDNGIGIEPRFFERIFEVFQRLHNREQFAGTGIGLAVCKKIVERHGGRIRVDSEPGAGATFSFTISKHCGEPA